MRLRGLSVREGYVAFVSLLLLVLAIHFLLQSFSLMVSENPRVAASLLAALIGFVLLSTGASLARTLVAARAAGGGGERG